MLVRFDLAPDQLVGSMAVPLIPTRSQLLISGLRVLRKTNSFHTTVQGTFPGIAPEGSFEGEALSTPFPPYPSSTSVDLVLAGSFWLIKLPNSRQASRHPCRP